MVTYTENPLLPGQPVFRCEALSASITVKSCAGMWTQANAGEPVERLWRCKGCKLGAEHAGAGDVAMNPLRGVELCVRCSRTDLRLIWGLWCVSCYNRGAEAKKGRNARGVPPAKHPGLRRFKLRYSVGGEAGALVREAVSADELAIELLRDQAKRVTFGLGKLNGPG